MKPMSIGRSLLFFGIPALIILLMFWGGIPLLDMLGHRLFFTFLIALGGPLTMMFLASLYFYRREGNEWSWSALQSRFRLHWMNGKDWLWAIGLAVFMFAGNALLSSSAVWIQAVIPYPKFFVRMIEPDPNYFMEIPVPGNWWLMIGFLGFSLANVFGEEFWWRGYVLPRQELTHGKRTWLVHGLFWNLFHIFMPWNLIAYIPGTFALPFVVQRLRNTWPAIIAHFAQNIPTLVRLVLGVLGK